MAALVAISEEAAAAAADDDDDLELLERDLSLLLLLLLLPPDDPDLDDDRIELLLEVDSDPDELDFWKGALEEDPELEDFPLPLLLLLPDVDG